MLFTSPLPAAVSATLILQTLNGLASARSIIVKRQNAAISDTAPLYFPVEHLTLHNARQDEPYTAHIGGLALGKSNTTATFTKDSGPDWITISSNGTISGIPSTDSLALSNATIIATSEDTSTVTLMLTIPVRPSTEPLLTHLNILSYNLWAGGTNIQNYHAKQIRFLLSINADIVGVQESTTTDEVTGERTNHTTRLAEALGWYHFQSNRSIGVLSRYPLTEVYGEIDPVEIPVANDTGSPGGGVRVNLNGASDTKQELNIWSAHLHYTPYGPYDFCFYGNTSEEVLENEAFSGREGQMRAIIERITPQLDNAVETPVVLVGDMNAPSHLDWTDALSEKHCGVGGNFPWPTSELPTAAGLVDSFRVAKPNPVEVPGDTWSPVYPFNEGDEGPEEPQDRIDFVYGSGGLVVEWSEILVVGEPRPVPNVEENEWTSDHAAVLTRYRLPVKRGDGWSDV